ncbi:hypothetical protein KKG90_01580 [Candidatus Bipolaricaulota bacterium]|nr:hypothetical protein [Candidatus Bipolaricaulota bacterium]
MVCVGVRLQIRRCCIHAWMLGLSLIGLLVVESIELQAVTISVSQFALVCDPGDFISESFVILNSESRPVDLELELVDWDRTLDGITHILDAGALARSCASWMSLPVGDRSLLPDAEIEIPLSIQIPAEVQGTYWAAILVSARLASGSVEDGDIEALRQFLVRVFVTVSPATFDGRVSDLKILGTNPLGIEVTFLNSGNTMLWRVSGMAAVESLAGDTLFQIPMVPFDVLPEHAFRQSVFGTWGLPTAGAYLVRAVIDFGAEYLVAGQFVLRIDELHLIPIGTADFAPADHDGDGLYEDVDGDGVPTEADATLLAEQLDSPSIQDNARAFDFNNDGVVTAADVDTLRGFVLRATE